MSTSILAILPILTGLTLLITIVGFKRMVYFLNIGYAFSIVAVVAAAAALLWKNCTVLILVQSAAIILWGMRLGIFVLKRELNPGYKKERDRIDKEYGNITLPIKFAIWICVSILYLMMVSPVLFSLEKTMPSDASRTIFQAAGAVIMIGGWALEGVADKQKSEFKAKNPNKFCNTGLYRSIRCPNYLGEILFWIGNWVMGIGYYKTWLEWVISLFGMACIVFIMFGSTKRLERTQISRYGNSPEYQQYCQTVPILIPGVPLYSLQNSRFIK